MDGDKMIQVMHDLTLGKRIDRSKMSQEDRKIVAALSREITENKAEGKIIDWENDMPSL